ncbi:MAG: hypothetical protein ACYTDX_04100 [Planctomycetota bacterium]
MIDPLAAIRVAMAPLQEAATADPRLHFLDLRIMPQEQDGTFWVILEIQLVTDEHSTLRDEFFQDPEEICPALGRWILEWAITGVLTEKPWRRLARELVSGSRED